MQILQKNLQHFLKTLKQPSLHENHPYRIKNLFSIMRLQDLQDNLQNKRKIIENVNMVTC